MNGNRLMIMASLSFSLFPGFKPRSGWRNILSRSCPGCSLCWGLRVTVCTCGRCSISWKGIPSLKLVKSAQSFVRFITWQMMHDHSSSLYITYFPLHFRGRGHWVSWDWGRRGPARRRIKMMVSLLYTMKKTMIGSEWVEFWLPFVSHSINGWQWIGGGRDWGPGVCYCGDWGDTSPPWSQCFQPPMSFFIHEH